MNYPPPQKAHHWRSKLKARPEPQHKIVRKKIHGQWVLVKVYESVRINYTEDGSGLDAALKEANRFSRDRGAALEKKAYDAKVAEGQK